MLRALSALLLAFAMLAGCGSDMKTKDKVQAAIIQRLKASSGLDLKNLDVTTTSVTFDKNLAYANVAFHPKDDPRITAGMQMKYTLEDRDGKWVVTKVGDSQGHGLTGGQPASGSGQLPPGHPSLDPNAPGGAMPDGAAPSGANPHAAIGQPK